MCAPWINVCPDWLIPPSHNSKLHPSLAQLSHCHKSLSPTKITFHVCEIDIGIKMVPIRYYMIALWSKKPLTRVLGTSRPSTKGSVSIPHHDFPITDSEDQGSCSRQPPLVIISLVNVTSSYCIFLFIATRQRSSLDYTTEKSHFNPTTRIPNSSLLPHKTARH